MRSLFWFMASTLLFAPALAGAAPCRDHNPQRNAYFGDLHVHTAFSLDAIMQDTRTDPTDAYRYARGEAIGIPPYGDDGKPLRMVVIGRPLDFMAVTDHAEMLGETRMCHTEGMDGYWSPYCMGLRWIPRWAGILFARTALERTSCT